MKVALKSALIALALAGCSLAPIAYPKIEPRDQPVIWRIISPEQLSDEAVASGLSASTVAFARWNSNTGLCIITTRPLNRTGDTDLLENIYHELRHCQNGRYHE